MSEYPDYSAGGQQGQPGGGQFQPGPGPDQAQAQYAPPPQQYAAQPGQPQYGVQQYAPPQGYAGAQGQPGMVIAPRSPAVALIASFFIPGLGSMLNERVGIGITILGIYILGAILSIFLIGIPIALGAWIWGLIDGYQAAQTWNRNRGIIS